MRNIIECDNGLILDRIQLICYHRRLKDIFDELIDMSKVYGILKVIGNDGLWYTQGNYGLWYAQGNDGLC